MSLITLGKCRQFEAQHKTHGVEVFWQKIPSLRWAFDRLMLERN
jgi:hypothetical protein